MQLFKHMEVVLMLAFGLVCATVALTPLTTSQPVPGAHGNGDAARLPLLPLMPTVHIVGRRLTPTERRATSDSAG